jgi:hypothetical protein
MNLRKIWKMEYTKGLPWSFLGTLAETEQGQGYSNLERLRCRFGGLFFEDRAPPPQREFSRREERKGFEVSLRICVSHNTRDGHSFVI